MKKTYSGSCHCGDVRFQCELDLTAVSGSSKCNCSICTKGRFWKAIVPVGEFRLLQGKDALSLYQFGNRAIEHLFCRRCGIKPFGHGNFEGLGEFYAINVACLDDATPQELAQASVQYEDGKNNRWDVPPAETRYL